MKLLSRILLVISIALMLYGYWGVFAVSGSKHYQEMDGYIPFMAMVVGAVMFIVRLMLLLVMKKKRQGK